MPKRTDIKTILLIGSGPIVIGSAAEFDYSGTQAALALKEEGYKVILVNPNPATIMTDQKIADKIYMEPLNKRFLSYIISIEKPDALIPSMGGQTALNLAVELSKDGILDKYEVEILGAPIKSIIGAEDREEFKQVMVELGIPTPESLTVKDEQTGIDFANKIGLPVIIRPSYTMGGGGGGIATTLVELEKVIRRGLKSSPVHEVLVEKSIAGFKEIEYEVMRDANDTAIVVCNMENIDPVGIHTGDSMVVAPSLTLTNKQYQMLRDVSLKIIRRFAIEGGCNVQLAIDTDTDNYYVIEINPRVSRSSALASKATGYPIANISAKIAVGYHLHEITNSITKKTLASFEPSIDYIVTKLPRFPFDKFRSNKSTLGTYMQATGETMSIGRNFEESFLKSVRSLAAEYDFVFSDKYKDWSTKNLLNDIKEANAYRLWQIFELYTRGTTVQEIHEATEINTYFLNKWLNINNINNDVESNVGDLDILIKAKNKGFSDKYISEKWNMNENDLFELRHKNNIKPTFKMIDTIAGEFESKTNYLYSTYMGTDNESKLSNNKKKVVIVGSGPIRIGQGVEFDYSTVHSIWSFQKAGYETIVINNNPETVSTDFSIADKLYFEPINVEEVMEIVKYEKPLGVVLQFGGQTAINIAEELEANGVNIIGTSFNSIDLAEDRNKFNMLLQKHNIKQPPSATTDIIEEIPALAKKVGYPVLIRPSYVIGGKGMQVVNDENGLKKYLKLNILDYKNNMILIDKYFPGKEVEVDAVSDGEDVFIPGIMEHVEKAGIHSGDSTTVFPAFSIDENAKKEIVNITKKLAQILKIKGLMNIQFILYESEVYVLEVNTRSSRSVPFISKATKTNIVDLSVQTLIGKSLKQLNSVGLHTEMKNKYFVKSPVFSFHKLHKVTDLALGPEMKSTGESIGIDPSLDKALYKSLLGANFDPLKHSKVIITVNNDDKPAALEIAKILHRINIKIYATKNTHKYFEEHDVESTLIDGKDKNASIIDLLKKEKISYVINTPSNMVEAIKDAQNIRTIALLNGVTSITSIRLALKIAKLTERLRFLIEPAY